MNPEPTSIRDLPEYERPREKLLTFGCASLSDAELLAIFLRTGIRGLNAIELAKSLLKHFGGLRSILQADLKHFCEHRGLGPAKYVQLQACIEMAKRGAWNDLRNSESIQSAEQAVSFLSSCLSHLSNEVFSLLLLDNKLRVIRYQQLCQGGLNFAPVSTRELLNITLRYDASHVILAHNHPSGDPTPSKADKAFTKRIRQLLHQIEVNLVDHLIIAGTKHYSFSANAEVFSAPLVSTES